jgi:carbamoyl-phosphate synthase large subunit
MAVCDRIGFPALVRPSYVLGGRAMTIVYDATELKAAMAELAVAGSLGREGGLSAERPVLIDRFLEDAVEVDVDAIRDAAGGFMIGGIMQHVEEAGVHSGDSACALPAPDLTPDTLAVLTDYTRRLADRLGVVGLINVQYAVKQGQVFVLEANPRASRTVPFVAKATGVPLVKIAARVMAGADLRSLRAEGAVPDPAPPGFVAVKEAVLPFQRFPEVDSVLGPEMRSTGEVMGIDVSFGLAFAKSQMAAGGPLPGSGCVFLSLADRDKPSGLVAARRFVELGFEIAATSGTAAYLSAQGVPVAVEVAKLTPGSDEPSVGVDAGELIEQGRVQMVVNTPRGRGTRADGRHIRTAAVRHLVPCLTTVAAAMAAGEAMLARGGADLVVRPLQAIHAGVEPTLPL